VKFIGQHIVKLIARFRSSVYLESLTDPGSDTDKFLVADSDGKVGYRTGTEVASDIGAASLTQEQVEDYAGALIATGGTKTGISITYQDGTGDMDFEVDHDAATNFVAAEHVDWAGASAGTIHSTNIPTLNQDTTGTASGLSSTLAVGSGGTGATTLSSNSLLTGNGTSAIQAEATLAYSSETLTIGDNDNGTAIIVRRGNSGGGGGGVSLKAGTATGTNQSGGHLALYGGGGTGTGVSGLIRFYGHGAGSSGDSANSFTEIAQLDSTGNLQIDGSLETGGGIELGNASDTTIARSAAGTVTIEGKEIVTVNKVLQQFNLSFTDDIGTAQHYLSWRDQYENPSLSGDEVDTYYLVPANGRVKCVYMRIGNITATSTKTVRVYSRNAGYYQFSAEQEQEATSLTATGDKFEVFAFYFDDAEHFQAGDTIKISVQDSVDSGLSQVYHITAVLEFDYTQMGRTDTGELA